MDNKEDILAQNIKEFFSEADSAFSRGSYNTATSLYFKALAVLADWIILCEEGFIPKSHSERFRVLEQKFPEVYDLLDKDFPAYQDSYSLSLDKNTAMVLKDDLKRIAQKVGFELGK